MWIPVVNRQKQTVITGSGCGSKPIDGYVVLFSTKIALTIEELVSYYFSYASLSTIGHKMPIRNTNKIWKYMEMILSYTSCISHKKKWINDYHRIHLIGSSKDSAPSWRLRRSTGHWGQPQLPPVVAWVTSGWDHGSVPFCDGEYWWFMMSSSANR